MADARQANLGIFIGLLALIGCGREAVQRPVAGRGTWVLNAVPSLGLSASRLSTAGCMQWVQKPQGEVLEFSSEVCPEELTSAEKVQFTLDIAATEDKEVFALKLHGVSVGQVYRKAQYASVRHLCQISDPDFLAPKPYSEFCQIVFKSPIEGETGRFAAVEIFSVEQVVESKVKELALSYTDAKLAREKVHSLEGSLQVLREQNREAQEARDLAYESLGDARQKVRDALASNTTSKRALERAQAEAQLTLAEAEARLVETDIRFATAERKRVVLLKARMAAAENAERLDKRVKAQIAIYQSQRIKDSEEMKIFLAVLDQIKPTLLTEDEKRELAQEISFATGESERLDDLEGKKAPAALRLVNDRKDALERLIRTPPQTNSTAP